MSDTKNAYEEGKVYILDHKLPTGGTVVLVKIYNDKSCRVQDTENKESEWDINLCRLSPVKSN